MGWETFTQGLKIYFNKYKWGNTTLPDFISSIQQGYDDSKPYEPLDLT
jgi:aminopeptidase N